MIAEFLIAYITAIIHKIGYFGIFILMVLESMIAPVPSEAVMPFAGFLVYSGKFNLFLTILASSIGSIIGSLLSYYIGFYGGRPFVMKLGRYLFLEEAQLDFTINFFKKYGAITIFISRFIPVVRHLISIPAGVGRMGIKKFVFYTLAGATLWNSFLIYVGMKLGENWQSISKYTEQLDILILVLIILAVIYYVYMHTKRKGAH
ncbi:MAG TPA: DedA family protein [Nanoarchaeota archaeon]|nr:DedA family protein [Nanoarchaeota archaeon]